jgi:hypothetical protein
MSKLKYLAIILALVLSFFLMPAVPALAAPVATSVTETTFGTDATDHYVNMPATVDAGDLLIVIFTNDGDAIVTTPAGWTQLASNLSGTAVRLSVYYKIAAGDEDSTTVNFVASAGEQAAAQVYRITDWHGTTPPEISTAATGTGVRPNPASLDPVGWGAADTLWLAAAGQDRGDQTGTTGYPAHYTDGVSTLSSNQTASCRILSARWVGTVASEDPGAFTIPVTEEWIAFTVAVRPAPHDLTISSATGGSVSTPGEGVFTYDEGTAVTLVATPDAGHRFVEWTGDVGTIAGVHAASTSINVNDNYSIAADFVRLCNLTTSSTIGGLVTEPGEGVVIYDEGTVVDLVATPDAGYRFVEWVGNVGTIGDVHAATTTVTMNGDCSVTAGFVKQYGLTISSTAGGTITTPGVGVFTYDTGTVVNLVATSSEGYYFAYWAGDVDTIAGVHATTTTVTMNGDYFITGNFEASSTPPPWGSGGGPCFIATAAYGTPTAKQINVLREFRDDVLLKNTLGSQFVAMYYRLSPPVANVIAGNKILRTLIREFLVDPIVHVVQATGGIWRS